MSHGASGLAERSPWDSKRSDRGGPISAGCSGSCPPLGAEGDGREHSSHSIVGAANQRRKCQDPPFACRSWPSEDDCEPRMLAALLDSPTLEMTSSCSLASQPARGVMARPALGWRLADLCDRLGCRRLVRRLAARLRHELGHMRPDALGAERVASGSLCATQVHCLPCSAQPHVQWEPRMGKDAVLVHRCRRCRTSAAALTRHTACARGTLSTIRMRWSSSGRRRATFRSHGTRRRPQSSLRWRRRSPLRPATLMPPGR